MNDNNNSNNNNDQGINTNNDNNTNDNNHDNNHNNKVGHVVPPPWLRAFATPINSLIGRDLCGDQGNRLHTITKVKFHLQIPLKIHWTITVTIHRESDNPLEHTTEK